MPLTIAVLVTLVGAAAVGWWARDPGAAWGTPSPSPSVTPTETPEPKPLCSIGPAPEILLTGSSTVNGWENYAADLSPLTTSNIGVPGTGLEEQLVYVKRIIPSLEPDVIVLYSGSNDTAAGMGSTDVVSKINTFVADVQSVLPKTVVYFVSINDTPTRSSSRGANDAVNQAVAGEATATGALRYIDTDSALRAADGSVDAAKFGGDGIHLNSTGYAIFGSIIRDRLMSDGYANRPCT